MKRIDRPECETHKDKGYKYYCKICAREVPTIEDSSLKAEVCLVLFENKDLGKKYLAVCEDMYSELSWACMRYSCEYKELSQEVMKDGWTYEKKVKNISW